MTAPDTTTETLDEQIARLTAERDAALAASASSSTADAPAPAPTVKVGTLVRHHWKDDFGYDRQGLGVILSTVEPWEQADGTMTERLFIASTLVPSTGPQPASAYEPVQ